MAYTRCIIIVELGIGCGEGMRVGLGRVRVWFTLSTEDLP